MGLVAGILKYLSLPVVQPEAKTVIPTPIVVSGGTTILRLVSTGSGVVLSPIVGVNVCVAKAVHPLVAKLPAVGGVALIGAGAIQNCEVLRAAEFNGPPTSVIVIG